jgi:hypothetical protein
LYLSQELDESFLLNVNEGTNQNPMQSSQLRRLLSSQINNPIGVLSRNPYIIIVQLPLLSNNLTLSSVQLEIANQSIVSFNGYPIQNRNDITVIDSAFRTSYSYEWMRDVGWIVSVVLWMLIGVNLFLGNCKVLFLIV